MGGIHLALFKECGIGLSRNVAAPSNMDPLNGMIFLRGAYKSLYCEHNALIKWNQELLSSISISNK